VEHTAIAVLRQALDVARFVLPAIGDSPETTHTKVCCNADRSCSEKVLRVKEVVRTHILLPRPLVQEIDTLVGQRRRSRFVEEAIEEKLRRARQLRALQGLQHGTDVLPADEYPHWAAPEKTSEWVHDLRREADVRAGQKVNGFHDDPSA
jgi:hypothetical protein